jgi:NAD(P)-dependent dehydrogenase (short-subunit alcohol dehydrogenase family)
MNKTVLITGATSGIGKAATETFAARGYTVFATYRSTGQHETPQAIENVIPVQMDVTNPDDLKRAQATIAAHVGDEGLYALINNAGTTYSAPFEFAHEQRAREVMDVNLFAPYRITQTFIPLLSAYSERHPVKSRVVNVASWAGVIASPFIPFYNASKFALVGLTESMFYDLRLLGIHTALAIPGLTKTPLLTKTTDDATASLDAMPPEGRARYQHLFDHYATMSARSESMPMIATTDSVARKLYRIVNKRKPKYRNHLGIDATIMDNIMTRLPWNARVAMNTHMYRLNQPAPGA